MSETEDSGLTAAEEAEFEWCIRELESMREELPLVTDQASLACRASFIDRISRAVTENRMDQVEKYTADHVVQQFDIFAEILLAAVFACDQLQPYSERLEGWVRQAVAEDFAGLLLTNRLPGPGESKVSTDRLLEYRLWGRVSHWRGQVSRAE